jgi:pSer/pThr/pTyr-binding forkhead associated (FHA) protein
VEVEDMLGLTQSTIETSVQVIVEDQQIPWWKTLLSSQGLIVVAAVVVSASVLVLVMLLGNRRNVHTRKQGKKRVTRRSDPLTQPVQTRLSTRKVQPRPAITPESPTRQRPVAQANAPARLIRLSENELPVQGQNIDLNRRELTFGTDPQQSICVLDSTSVNALHAHLVQVAEGDFVLSDANSVAGTWVNYAPVPKTGLQLRHGDLIHFGRLAFRFEMNNPPGMQQATISTYKEETL